MLAAVAVLAASAAGIAVAQSLPTHPASLLAATAAIPRPFILARPRRERPMPHPHLDLMDPSTIGWGLRTNWERTDLWARSTVRDWLRVSGPRPWSWAIVGLGTASVGTAVLLRGLTHTASDPTVAYAQRAEMNLSPGPLGSGCTDFCGLALAAGAQVLASGMMQLLSSGASSGASSDTYARAFVSTQTGLWVLGVMGSL